MAQMRSHDLVGTTCLGLSAQARALGYVYFCLLKMKKTVWPVTNPYFFFEKKKQASDPSSTSP